MPPQVELVIYQVFPKKEREMEVCESLQNPLRNHEHNSKLHSSASSFFALHVSLFSILPIALRTTLPLDVLSQVSGFQLSGRHTSWPSIV